MASPRSQRAAGGCVRSPERRCHPRLPPGPARRTRRRRRRRGRGRRPVRLPRRLRRARGLPGRRARGALRLPRRGRRQQGRPLAPALLRRPDVHARRDQEVQRARHQVQLRHPVGARPRREAGHRARGLLRRRRRHARRGQLALPAEDAAPRLPRAPVRHRVRRRRPAPPPRAPARLEP